MLIHELTIAVQRDRERQMHATLIARRHLSLACLAAPRGLLAGLRTFGRPARSPVPPAGSRHSSRIDASSV